MFFLDSRRAFGWLLAAFCLLIRVPAWADFTLGFDKSGGKDFSGFSVTSSVGFAPGESLPYEVFLYHAEQHSKGDFESRSYQYTLGMSHLVNDWMEAHGGLTYWRDTLSDLHYGGPSFGLSATWAAEPDDKLPEWTQGPPQDILSVSLNADVFVYGIDIAVSSTTRLVFESGSFQLIDVPATTEKLHVTQLHPNIMLDLLWFDAVKPYATAGHYFYSRDPARIEELIGLPHLSASFDQIGGLVGGFFSDSGEFGLRLPLPANLELSGSLGAAKSESTSEWATTQGATLHWLLLHRLDFKLAWNRGIQFGISTDVYTGGFMVMF